MGRFPKLGFLIAAVVVLLDQAIKWFFLEVVDLERVGPIAVLPIFSFTPVWNEGVSFGLLSTDTLWGRIGLTVFALVLAGFFARWLLKTDRLWPAVAIGLVIGGALGNALDRIVHGKVFDFLDFSGLGFPWIFNVADSAVNLAVAVFVIHWCAVAVAEGKNGAAKAEKELP